jgi:ferredoxin--NADP+ reductase
MMDDLTAGFVLDPAQPGAVEAESMISEHQPDYFSFEDWLKLDEIEVARGEASGRPRVKFTTREEMMEASGKQAAEPVSS